MLYTEGVVILILIFFIIVKVCIYYKKVRHMNDFDGPPTNFFLGNAADLRNTNTVLHVFHDYTKKYGNGICKVRVGVDYMLIATDYKFLEFILPSTKIIKKSKVYNYMSRWLGTGLLTSEGQKWKKHRRIITPAFHVQVLKKFMDTINAQTNKLVQNLEKEVGNDSFNIFPYITLYALDTICETTMGISVNAQNNASSDYVKSVHFMCDMLVERSMSPIKRFETTYKLTETYTKEIQALEIMHGVTNSVIREKKKKLKASTIDEYPRLDHREKAAFLDLLLQINRDDVHMSSEELRQEVDTFMFAGHDTTAAALGFCVHCLAHYPEIQEKVYGEQKEIFQGDIWRQATYNDVTQMKYLENVIKETLRLYPSVPFYSRITQEDIVYDQKVIPKGVNIIIFAYGIHRKEEYFPDPEKFDPSRFDSLSNKFPYAYIPFSAGPRNCIGQKFAMMEMKVAISNIIRHYELLPAIPNNKLQVAGLAILRAVNGIKIGLKKRKCKNENYG